MFAVLDDMVSLDVGQSRDPAYALALHVGLRLRGWDEVAYKFAHGEPDRIGRVLADRLAHRTDLRFLKLGVVWPSAESPERAAAFRERTGLDVQLIFRKPVVSEGAQPEDWAALFGFVLKFGWDAVAISKKANALVWFSHDEYLRATPSSLVRGI